MCSSDLGQALNADNTRLINLLSTRGIYLHMASRHAEAMAYLAQAALLAEQAGDNARLGVVLINQSEALAAIDPAAAAQAARAAAGHLRERGKRTGLAIAAGNLVQGLLLLGDWDAASGALTQAVDSDGLEDIEILACYRGWLAALRGDADTAGTVLAGLAHLQATDDRQDQALLAVVEAFIAAARGQTGNALTHARRTLMHADALGLNFESMRWAWPLAVRAACDLGDAAATREILAQLDAYPPGHVAPMLRAERELARARLAGRANEPTANASLTAAIAGLREHSTPYHLAQGLLDHAEYQLQHPDAGAPGRAVAEARLIAGRLRCQPLADRADAIIPALAHLQA